MADRLAWGGDWGSGGVQGDPKIQSKLEASVGSVSLLPNKNPHIHLSCIPFKL